MPSRTKKDEKEYFVKGDLILIKSPFFLYRISTFKVFPDKKRYELLDIKEKGFKDLMDKEKEWDSEKFTVYELIGAPLKYLKESNFKKDGETFKDK